MDDRSAQSGIRRRGHRRKRVAPSLAMVFTRINAAHASFAAEAGGDGLQCRCVASACGGEGGLEPALQPRVGWALAHHPRHCKLPA